MTEEQRIPDHRPDQSRAWLASILMRPNQTWLGRFGARLVHLASLGRGGRRWLTRKAAVSLGAAALLLTLGAGALRPVPVYAASITVDDGVVVVADDGQCSLIEAIVNANNDSALFASAGECAPGSGPDTINLPANGTFTLTTSYTYAYYSDNGLPLIDSDITIAGNGAEITRDGAAGLFRILAVSAGGDLTLNDATISNGYAGEDGGGIYNYGYALLQNCTLTGNGARDDGGGVENDTGTMIIDNCLITLNTAGELGGGVSSEDGGILTIRNNTQIRGNSATDVGGGLVADESGLLTINNSDITGNQAPFFGGGIATYRTTVIIENGSTISENYLPEVGGGADFFLSTVTITDSTISDNSAIYQGAGLHLDGSVVTIERSLISGNTVTNNSGPVYVGGGIYNGPTYDQINQDFVSGQLTVIDSTVSGNSGSVGGGIFNAYDCDLLVQNSTLTDNTAIYGGGVANVRGAFTIANSTISNNRAIDQQGFGGSGGGVFNLSFFPEGDPETYIILSTITGNSATNGGGGITNYSGPLFVVSSIVSGNTGYGIANEIGSNTYATYTYSSTNVLGHSGETNAQAFYGFLPTGTDITATSDGTTPTALGDILNTTLADNGGPTETHALVSGSPAIDYVPPSICASVTPVNLDLSQDQRGEPRNVDIPGTGNDGGGNNLCDVGAYELQPEQTASFCPVDVAGVGYLRTDLLGVGQGGPNRAYRTRKLNIPNSQDVSSLYGQLAAVDLGVMKYVRFLPQGNPKEQIYAPTSPAYRTSAVDWWGSELPADARWVKGQFFWGKGANRSPRAFVLWPTYETVEAYANAFVTFDESSENHVYWNTGEGWIAEQTQTVSIPTTQAPGATVVVKIALVDNNNDNRPVILTATAGTAITQIIDYAPNAKDTLNLHEITLTDVPEGVDEVVIHLESPSPEGEAFPAGGDSTAMIGAAVSYECAAPLLGAPQSGPATGAAEAAGSPWSFASRGDRIERPATPRVLPEWLQSRAAAHWPHRFATDQD